MRSWFLGVFLARRSRLATRYLAAASGAILAIALCFIFGLIQFLDDASARADTRQFGADSADGCVIGGARGDVFDHHQYERIVVARYPGAQCADAPAPPGLARFPDPGEVFVSPALAALRGSDPTIAERFPTIAGVIQPDGLLASNELRAIVGGDSEFYDRTFNVVRFDRWGASIGWITGYLRIDASSLLAFGILFCVPLSIWLIYVGTLVNAKVRERQLGVLAVVGLDATATCRALVTESLVTVGAGALVGVAASKLALRTMTPTFTGLTAFRGDYEPSWSTIIRVVLAVFMVAMVASMVAATRSVFAPRRAHRRRRRGASAVSAVVLAVGVAIGVAGLVSFDLRGMGNVVLAGKIITFAGIVLAVPTLARFAGGVMRDGRATSGEIVGSRLRRPSGSLNRAVAALAGGLFVVSLAQSTTAAVVDDPQLISDLYTSDGRSLLYVRYPDAAVLDLLHSYDVLAGYDPAPGDPTVLSGSCEAVRAATGSTGPCPASGIYFTYQGSGAQADIRNRLNFSAEAELPSGPRGDQFLEQVVKLTQSGAPVTRPDTVYVPVPVDAVDALYNQIIATDQDINVQIAGAAYVTGATELNSIADVFRWGGYFAVAASLIGAGIAVIALAYDRRLATQYLEVLGLSRRRSAALLVSELLVVSTAAAVMAAACAWLWGAEYAMGYDVKPADLLTVIGPFIVGLVGQTLVSLLVAAPALRAARTAVIDGDAEVSDALRPFARRDLAVRHVPIRP